MAIGVQFVDSFFRVRIFQVAFEFDVEQGSFVSGTGDGGDAGSLTPSVSAFYTRPINEKWSMGLSGLALTGSALDYDDDWVGRFEAQDVSIIVIGASVSPRMMTFSASATSRRGGSRAIWRLVFSNTSVMNSR